MTSPNSHPARSRTFAEKIRERLDRGASWRWVRWMKLGDAQQVWYLKRLFRLLEVDLVIDVGGNRGQYADLIRSQVKYRGPLITVEPIPELAQALRALAAGDPQWGIVETALDETDGTASFNIMERSELSSLLNPSTASTTLFEKDNVVARTITINKQRLEALIAAHPLAQGKQRIYLKLDVQGNELPILRSAGLAMPRVVAMQAELSAIPLYAGMAPYHQQMGEIESLGFQISFIPAHNYTQFPDMIDFDCHFVSQAELKRKKYLV
jgi:FkbM family methyltransferase